MGNIQIGWAEESLVPDKKVSLSGQFFERISEFVESEISVTAMAVEAEGEQMIIISCDTGAVYDGHMTAAREKFAALNTEVDPAKLIVCATHTHTSLVMDTNLKAEGEGSTISSAKAILEEFLPADKQYNAHVTVSDDILTPREGAELFTDKIALAAHRAWQNRTPAYYANEFGRAAVGMCRRASYDDGSAQMWGDTNTANFVSLEGGNDSGVELLYTFDQNKKLTGVVANIACPAQILEQRSFISADFWGRAKANIREKLGEDVYLLALCGAAGDQCPRDLVRWVQPEAPIDDPNVHRPYPITHKADPSMYDIAGCNKVGKRISNEILSVYEDITDIKDEAVFRHEILNLNVPLRKATMAEYTTAVKELKAYIAENSDRDFNFDDLAKMHVYAGLIKRYRDQQWNEVVPIEVHIVRLGNIAFATNPYELFLDYGNRMKARSYAQQTFVVQLCCGCHAYLPTEKAEKAGHYSAYISSGDTGHAGGDILVRETVNAINKMFKE